MYVVSERERERERDWKANFRRERENFKACHGGMIWETTQTVETRENLLLRIRVNWKEASPHKA